jgi:hypothetical protein
VTKPGQDADSGRSRRLVLTGGVAAGASIAALPALLSWAASPASAATGQGTTDWLNVVSGYDADPTGSRDSTADIQDALNAASPGQVVYMPTGTYLVSAPLAVPSGVVLLGDHGNVLSLSGYGTVIAPGSGWAQGDAPAAGVIVFASGTEEQQVRDLMIDGSAGPAVVHGIASAGAQNVLVRDVYLCNVTGDGVIQNSADDTWYADHVTVHQAGGSGFTVSSPDSVWLGCKALGCGTTGTYDGWSVTASHNSKFIGCASEWSSGNGYSCYSDFNGGGAGGLSFTACTTDRNAANGFSHTALSTWPLLCCGCTFRRDGRNGGSGGGGYAGIATSGAQQPLIVSGCVVLPGVDDDGTEANSPEYGLSVDSGSQVVSVDGGILWGASAALDSGAVQQLAVSPGTRFRTGSLNGPSNYNRQGRAVLSGGTASVAFPEIDSATPVLVTNTAPGGTPGFLTVSVTAGTGFMIKSSSAADSSTVCWAML